MIPEAAAAGVLGTAGAVMAWAVRGRSSQLLAPSVWRGPADRKQVALTFDDGPSESTAAILDLLDRESARATFFQCGRNVERLPSVSRLVAGAGHEIGNHTYSHSALYLRHPQFIRDELDLAQQAIGQATGARPTLFRPTYGCRWFGLRAAQRDLGLTGVMWSTIGLDWKLNGDGVLKRLTAGIRGGAIFCLHDGRQTEEKPDISATLDAVRRLIPLLKAQGYAMVTVSELICRKTSPHA